MVSQNMLTIYKLMISKDGTFRLDQSYFDYSTGLKMTNNKFNKLFGQNSIQKR